MSQRKVHGGRKGKRRKRQKPAARMVPRVSPVEDVRAAPISEPAASVAEFWPSVRLFLQRVGGALGVYL
jgi:hypothetical protein